MKCRLCGKKLTLKEYSKHICKECIEKLPKCLQDDIHTLDIAEAKSLITKFHHPEGFSEPDHYQVWYSYGNIGITTTGVVIEKKHIVLFKDIKNFYFDYLPRRAGSGDICFGEFSFHFELKGFPYEFRTLALACGVHYRIEKEKFYPEFPEEMIRLSNFIRQGALSDTHCLKNEKEKYEADYREGYYTWRRDEKFAKNSKQRKSATGNSRSNTEQKKSYQNTGENQKNKDSQQHEKTQENKQSSSYSATDDLTGALRFFGLKIPYSQQELKSVYRKMIRQCHPDQQVNTSDLKPEDVNRCYGILKKYAS